MISRTTRGFTIIELLVVIAILGVLAAVVAATNLTHQVRKARDARRVANLAEIKKALEQYYLDYGTYPDNTDADDQGCWGCIGAGCSFRWDAGHVLQGPSDTFLKVLEDGSYMKQVPKETHTELKDRWNVNGFPYCFYRYTKQMVRVGTCSVRYAVLYTMLETDSVAGAKGDERPDCVKPGWGEGAVANDYAIYLPMED